MAASNTKPSQISPLDLILSCTVCQDTLTAVYAVPDDIDGLRRGTDSTTNIIPRLWLTECAHVICGKHFDGGGPPFHPEGQQPRAPCPYCEAEKGDNTNKTLFGIQGCSPGEHNENIPDAYFKIPPVKLTGDDPGLEAMRFQYLSLLRYGTKKEARCRYMQQEMDDLRKAASNHAAAAEILQEEKTALKKENLELRENLRIWENRRPELIRFMRALPPLVEELKKSRKTLRSLGQDVSAVDSILHPYEQEAADPTTTRGLADNVENGRDTNSLQAQVMDSSKTNGIAGLNDGSGNEASRRYIQTNGSATPVRIGTAGRSRLAQSSAADLDMLSGHGTSFRGGSEEHFFNGSKSMQPPPINGSSAKRKRVDTSDDWEGRGRYRQDGSAPQRETSRDLMPPPAIPFRHRRPPSPVVSNIETQPYHRELQRDNIRPLDYHSPNHFEPNAHTNGESGFRWHNGHERYTDSDLVCHYGDQPNHILSQAPVLLPRACEPYDEDANRPFIYDRPPASAHANSRPTNRTSIDTTSYQSYVTPMRTPSRVPVPVSLPNSNRGSSNIRPLSYNDNCTRNTNSHISGLNDGELDQYRTTTQPYLQPPTTSPIPNRITLPPPTPGISRNGINPYRRSGMFAGVRSSNSNLNSHPNPDFPTTPRPHREPLAMRNTNPSNPGQQSPFFAARALPDMENLFNAPQQEPRAQRQEYRQSRQTTQRVMNGLSFMQEPVVPGTAGSRGLYSASGRRRARR